MPAIAVPTDAAVIGRGDQAAARRDLRDQIGRLERELACAVAAAFPHREPATGRGRSASAIAGPRLLGLGELEAIRDELAARIAALRRPPAAARLAAMYADPPAHRWERVTSEELGEPGCRHWQVRPRLGLIGMLAGWWHVKLSSGCP
ncbi:MAG: hypothetical protein ABW060_01240 [Solirubrobacteraceae bacterium]